MTTNLVLAAPDMLEALEMLLDWECDLDGHHDFSPVFDKAVAAVAKAKGRDMLEED